MPRNYQDFVPFFRPTRSPSTYTGHDIESKHRNEAHWGTGATGTQARRAAPQGLFVLYDMQQMILTNIEYVYLRVPSCGSLETKHTAALGPQARRYAGQRCEAEAGAGARSSEEGSTGGPAVYGACGDSGAGEVVEVHHGAEGDDADARRLRECAQRLLHRLLHMCAPLDLKNGK